MMGGRMIRLIRKWTMCAVGRHEPRRRSIWHDGIDQRSRCRNCRRALINDRTKGWRAFDADDATNPGRTAVPDR